MAIIEFFLVNLFLVYLMCGNISNYTPGSFIVKLGLAILLSIIIIIDASIKKYNLKNLFGLKYSTNIYFIIIGFLALFLITLSWSNSIPFGMNKILIFLVGIVPVIFASLYLIETINKTRISIFYFSIITASVLFVILIVLLKPFDYNGNYIISATKWSHVIYAHFALITFLILLMTILFYKGKYIIFISIGLFTSLIGIYISGLRAGMLGAVIFTIPVIVIALLDKKSIKKNIYFALLVIIAGSVFCYVYSKTEKTVMARIDNLAEYQNMKFNSDETLLTRIDGYRIAFNMFKEHPIGGAGFGGFKNYKGNWFTNSHKYPHNIFLEFLAETGSVGCLYFLFFLFYLVNVLRKISPFLLILFFTGLWFALFSKDIPSQSLLFVFISFTALSAEQIIALRSQICL